MDRLFVVFVLTMFIHLIIVLNYSCRLAGLRTRRLLTAISICSVINLAASAANTIQAPLLSSLVEHTIMNGALETGVTAGNGLLTEEFYQVQLSILAGKLRLVILAATAGSVAAAFFIPTAVNLFTRAVRIFEATGSMPRMLGRLFLSLIRGEKQYGPLFHLPSLKSVLNFARQKILIPKTLPLINILTCGVFTTGVLSSLYAGALYPDFRSTAVVMSGVVNGMAMVVMALAVEPRISLITDEAMRGNRGEADVKQLVFYMVVTRLIATLTAQVFFLPCAYLIRLLVRLLTN